MKKLIMLGVLMGMVFGLQGMQKASAPYLQAEEASAPYTVLNPLYKTQEEIKELGIPELKKQLEQAKIDAAQAKAAYGKALATGAVTVAGIGAVYQMGGLKLLFDALWKMPNLGAAIADWVGDFIKKHPYLAAASAGAFAMKKGMNAFYNYTRGQGLAGILSGPLAEDEMLKEWKIAKKDLTQKVEVLKERSDKVAPSTIDYDEIMQLKYKIQAVRYNEGASGDNNAEIEELLKTMTEIQNKHKGYRYWRWLQPMWQGAVGGIGSVRRGLSEAWSPGRAATE